ncbi:hypothetical protein NOVOSPHI9U_260277 [Novosphingobium sp. 9U]|nr:hypothetical protein NOVOSPHI9U_260277 [Novosphingobium sp. 9U]
MIAYAALAMEGGRREESFLGRNGHSAAFEYFCDGHLARQTRARAAVLGAIEQVTLILAHRLQLPKILWLDVHVTSCTRAAAAAQSQEFVKTAVTNNFHESAAFVGFDA